MAIWDQAFTPVDELQQIKVTQLDRVLSGTQCLCRTHLHMLKS